MKLLGYVKARTLSEALARLDGAPAGTRVLAGGTDLLVQMKQKKIGPQYLVSISHLSELKGLCYGPRGELVLGSLTTSSELEESAEVRSRHPLLAEAARAMAGPEIRRRATVGGNLANASPAADIGVALLALDAVTEARSSSGSREIEISQFFLGPGKTVLDANEIITAVRVPRLPPDARCTYIKLGMRRAMEIAIVNVAAVLVPAAGGRVAQLRLAVGAVAPTPLRLRDVEAMVEGRVMTPELAEAAAQRAREGVHPISDVRASAWYRQRMVEVLVRRALEGLVKG